MERMFGVVAMLVRREPDAQEKVALLGESARFELCGPEEQVCPDSPDPSPQRGLLFRPAGKQRGRLLKVLLSSACHNSCLYCAFRAGADIRRTSLRPEELARSFLEMQQRGRASGIFLSSGMAGDAYRTMEEMLRTIEILRHRERFSGYVHLKILPGAADDQIQAACRLADRVSTNIEAPNAVRLAAIAPEKRLDEELLGPLRRVAALRRSEQVLPLGHTTQFVVGAAGESDLELLEVTSRLYTEDRLTRAHYSAFTPLPGTPLEGRAATPPIRQRRLYQADALLHQYGFRVEELPLDDDGNLPMGRDPKVEWAVRHPERFPMEVNRASREELLRVPGIGPRSAGAIVRSRRSGRIASLQALRALSVATTRAAPFLLLDGRRPVSELPVQAELWPHGELT